MGLLSKRTQLVTNRSMIDTGLNVLLSLGLPLVPAARGASMRNANPVIAQPKKKWYRISNQNHGKPLILYSFRKTGIFRKSQYFARANSAYYFSWGLGWYGAELPDLSKDLRVNARWLHRVSWNENLFSISFLPSLWFLSTSQLRNIHENLDHRR